MLRLICIDVDGTLVGESGKPSLGVLNVIKRARSLGQSLALTTARGAMGPTLDYASLLNPDGWHIFHAGIWHDLNAATTYRFNAGVLRVSNIV